MSSSGNTVVHAQLSRDMGLFSVTMIGVGAMIGAGIFVLTGISAGTSGPGLLLAFALNGIFSLITAMAYAELGAAVPEAGGGYLWVKESLPNPSGFLSGWISWFAHSVACSLYALGFSVYFSMLLKALNIHLVFLNEEHLHKVLAVFVCIILAYINYRGAKETGRMGAIITIGKIVILGIFIGAGMYRIYSLDNWTGNFTPFLPKGYSGVFMAMGLTFIAFEGYEIIAQSGEEIKNPHKNIPRAIFLSLLIVVPIYLLVGFSAIGAVQVENMASWEYLGKMKELAILEAARNLLPGGAIIILFGGLLSTLSALNATIYSSSRVAFAMARDSNLPEVFNRVSTKTRTPVFSITITMVVVIGMAVFLPIEDVASAADIMFLFLFVFVNMALINLRRHRPELKRYFRVPLVPFLPVLGIISLLFITIYLSIFSPLAWFTVTGWITTGIILYYSYSARLEKEIKGSKIAIARLAGERKDFGVLVSVRNEEEASQLAKIAALIAKARSGEVIAMNIVEVPEQLPLTEGLRLTENRGTLLENARKTLPENNVPFHLLVRVAHRIDDAITDTVKEYNIKFVLLGWEGHIRNPGRTFGTNIDAVLRKVPCDVALLKYKIAMEKVSPITLFRKFFKIFRWKKEGKHDDSVREIKRIFLPTSGGPNARFAAELASEIAKVTSAELTVATIIPETEKQDGEEFLDSTLKDIDFASTKLNKKILKSHSIMETILNESKNHDMIIIGASRRSLYHQMRYGSLPRNIALYSQVPVMIVKKYEGTIKSWIKRFLGQ